MSENINLFQKFRTKRKSPMRCEADGSVKNSDILEDEEQILKFEEIIGLLVAAGYFRARIKGLTPFDKVVGGITWCIESCNIDVDVDILFQENSTIGQKIALTEKIVAILPKMKCPCSIEPHQIQGMDFVHIFPVIQWLVKRSLEYRQEKSAFVRKFAVNQFNKQYKSTGDEKLLCKQENVENVNKVNNIYKITRYYKRKNASSTDTSSRIQITLLEYTDKVENIVSQKGTSEQDEEQKCKNLLLNNLTVNSTLNEDLMELKLNDAEKKNLAEHYAELQKELRIHIDPKDQSKVFSKQLDILNEIYHKVTKSQTNSEALVLQGNNTLREIRQQQKECNKMLNDLINDEKTTSDITEIEKLLILNDDLKQQENQFRNHCKQELVRLQNLIKEKKLKKQKPMNIKNSLSVALPKAKEEVKNVRLKLAKKNRIVSALQRQLDDVPNRAELAQYQRRFLELYNQVATKHKETKQYFSLYNTLEDTRLYMKKELSLLNSVSDSYPEAMQTVYGKRDFLKQFEDIVEGLRQSKSKMEKKLCEEKSRRDELSCILLGLVEMQRKYVNVVSQMTVQCKKYEALVAKTNKS